MKKQFIIITEKDFNFKASHDAIIFIRKSGDRCKIVTKKGKYSARCYLLKQNQHKPLNPLVRRESYSNPTLNLNCFFLLPA
ncbi:hypothetical protein [Flavihumibacter sp. ZG627]|uniref:hypothetical protein n=1 Tax=Flavihumibacter sp. ZG627 TaxID=1463156 RepID=UPI0005809008|nr:hypothetical protein [Flavihumibacter sp. ZG627]KIC91665.1 hypothetical protein HY58_05390 [Flavihumibacter sp. ZG627]